MKAQNMKAIESAFTETFEDVRNDDHQQYKECPCCGQRKIPFKMGVCVCGNQVGGIQYVNSAEKFANVQYYSYVGTPNVDKLGIAELTDN